MQVDPQILRFCSSVAEFLEKYTFSLNTYSKILSPEPVILDLDLALTADAYSEDWTNKI